MTPARRPRDPAGAGHRAAVHPRVVGIDSMEVLRQDLATARSFKPLTGERLEKLLAKVAPVAGDGRHERFKSTQFFDGPYHQKQHGLTKELIEGT
jgi:hypothetical protein